MMQFNDTAKRDALNAFSRLPQALREQIQFSTVRLSNDRFTGSGVLVIDANQIPGIVTAKHNLCVRAGIATPTAWNEDQVAGLITGFLDGLKVGYDFPATAPDNIRQPLPAKEQILAPDNSDIEFRNGYGRWDYDLMFISFKARLPLRDYIAASPSHRVPYGSGDLAFYRQDPAGKGVYVTGFGDVRNAQGGQLNLSHPFQVRNAVISSRQAQALRHSRPDLYFTDALIVEASNNSSTATGDSGGPMLHVSGSRVYLMGATLGANFLPDRLPPDAPIINNAATALYAGGYLF
ncbi:trypsin-like serine protease [Chromobacterium violaceum]|uniref:trypsin-like serine protease n=1 Tax=Chromobacterium violaceum TaxID=536 RepID=UPI001B321004|nr:trypsin-like serine protease [Chromobacterium violaceum]